MDGDYKVYIFYLFIRHIPYPTTAGSARNNAKKRDKRERTKKKWIGAQGKTIYPPTQTIDALMGEEEKRRKNKRNRERAPNPSN